jgi:DNA-binding response OmpR family regulator
VKTPVLVIDNDLGFAFWLAKALDGVGYQAFPARNLRDAGILLSEIPMNLSLLVLAHPPADGDPFLARLRRQHRDVRILYLAPEDEAEITDFRFDSQFPKPAGRTSQDLSELLVAIEHLLESEPVFAVSEYPVSRTMHG